jgi:hypothetical protein
MSSYLEAYGASEELRARRIRLIKISSIVLALTLLAGGTLYAVLKNRSEEQQAKLFVHLLNDHNYSEAYKLWGCNTDHPCPNYPESKFLEDWGPHSAHADESSAEIGLSQSCGSGVIVRLDYPGSVEPVPLWIERSSQVISFSPQPECPGRQARMSRPAPASGSVAPIRFQALVAGAAGAGVLFPSRVQCFTTGGLL